MPINISDLTHGTALKISPESRDGSSVYRRFFQDNGDIVFVHEIVPDNFSYPIKVIGLDGKSRMHISIEEIMEIIND